MRIAVIGGTGLIGSQVVRLLNARGHEAVPESPASGLDLLSGKGLPEALKDMQVAVNVTNSPTFDDASPAFFQQTMDNLLPAASSAGVGHIVILSIVGADEVPGLVYYRAKVLQENILKAGPVPYSIVRATQFFEFLDQAISESADESTVRLPSTLVQPMASADVAKAVSEVCAGPPMRGMRSVAGPEVFGLDELGRITLAARSDHRTVVTDNSAGMFAAASGDALIAKEGTVIARTTYRDWLALARRQRPGKAPSTNARPNIVLVHGAWADGSSWNSVIERLQADGYSVTAPQFPESSLTADVARLRQVLARQDGPTIVVGHSYGGQIVTALGTDAPNLVGIVYIAAFGLDEGESIGRLLAQSPAGPALAHLDVDDQGFAWLPEDDFIHHFAADIDQVTARAMHAVQQPLAWSALDEVMGVPAWRSQPTWFMIADGDQTIPPDAERQFAARMGATTVEIPTNHVAMVSHPDDVVNLIHAAAKTLQPA
jgi:uncharacterized protein YbjT (DUF2867 family)